MFAPLHDHISKLSSFSNLWHLVKSKRSFVNLSVWAISSSLLIAGCALFSSNPENNPNPQASQAKSSATPAATSFTLTPTPIPRQLTICLAQEPETLYLYGNSSPAQRHVLQAIYDGPIDIREYGFEPVILKKIPNLMDGDARIQSVTVKSDDWVVNDNGDLVQLQIGEKIRPAGCSSPECALVWDGSPLEMSQLSADFTLLDGIQWSDGAPLTAADSVFSYHIAKDCQSAKSPCGGNGLAGEGGLVSVQRTADYVALDERNLRWSGVPGFLDPNYQTNFFIPQPQHQLERFDLQNLGTLSETSLQPLGWGPYQIETWDRGESLILAKNPSYFRAGEALPKFDRLVFFFVQQMLAEEPLGLLAGKCDLFDQETSQFLNETAQDELTAMGAEGKIANQLLAGPLWEHLDFGILPVSYDDGYQPGVDRPDFFADVRVRQAIGFCLDRQQIIEEVLQGKSAIPRTYIPDNHPLVSPTLPDYSFNPQEGENLLDQVGWVDSDGDPITPRISLGIPGIFDGTPLKLTLLTSQAKQRQEVAQIIKQLLATCGMQIEIETMPGVDLFAPGPEGPVFGRRFDLTQFAWDTHTQPICTFWTSRQIPGDPSAMLEDGSPRFPQGWGGLNETGYQDPNFDRLCETAMTALPGEDGYQEDHYAAQQLFSEALPVIPLYQRLTAGISRPDFCGYSLDPSAGDGFWNIENYDYGTSCP
jgi:peptide/nickel transport system substrate-binding protein